MADDKSCEGSTSRKDKITLEKVKGNLVEKQRELDDQFGPVIPDNYYLGGIDYAALGKDFTVSRRDNILYQCVECQRHRVIKNGIDGNRCNYCDGYLNAIGTTNLPTSKEVKECKSIGEITAKVSIDVSAALTGLKAVQREARKATTELKKLEAQQDQMVDLPFHPEVTT